MGSLIGSCLHGMSLKRESGLSTEPELVTEQYETCGRSHLPECPRSTKAYPVLLSFTSCLRCAQGCWRSMGEEQNDFDNSRLRTHSLLEGKSDCR